MWIAQIAQDLKIRSREVLKVHREREERSFKQQDLAVWIVFQSSFDYCVSANPLPRTIKSNPPVLNISVRPSSGKQKIWFMTQIPLSRGGMGLRFSFVKLSELTAGILRVVFVESWIFRNPGRRIFCSG